MPADGPFVSAVLLAAGASTRMGRQKAMLPWRGTTLIDDQLAQLSSVAAVREIIVVTGHEPGGIDEAVRRHPRARTVRNAAHRSGKVSSVLAGLRAVDPSSGAILLVAVDQPRPAALIGTLISAHFGRGALVTVPVREGRRGHPVIFSRALLPELLAISEDTLGIRAVLQAHEGEVTEVEVRDPVIHLDLNRPQDLEPRA